jgi:hypothetical protein
LKDYKSFGQGARSIREMIFRELLTQKLAKSRREVVYPFGAAEGLLLDVANPGWRHRYFADKFDLSKYYPTRSRVGEGNSESTRPRQTP